ncbi:MAG TPA: T9SS type A sorting domain-containing protein [Flavipsychrobacter sp.]|nr:T9SS type A sorting domain-containing protein [Flavipsychrobacter sp.]
MHSRILWLFIFIFPLGAANAQVWSTDVAPILYNSCVSCHRSGGIAPFSLTTFTEAVNSAASIASAVTNKRMPPWPPDPSYKKLAHERLLSQQEINTIVNWVNNGQQQGNPTLAPPIPVFNNNGDIPGTPDLVTKIPTYASQASNGDVYRCFVVQSGLNVQKFITGFEAIPGNRSIVHHVLVYADTTGTCASLDNNDPGPGYTSFGGVGTNKAILLGGWVPGTDPLIFPNGFGVPLPPNADIVIQIHYPAGTQGMVDSTEVHFFFSAATNVRSVFIAPVLNHQINLQNGPLSIPANQTKTFVEHFSVPSFPHFSLLGIAPHMHLIGRNIECFGVSPANDTIPLIRVNNWNFHWQGFYLFPKIQKIEAGSDLYAKAFFDNTSNNPFNPSNPPQNVFAGEATTDEMMLVYFLYSYYQPGDENIIIDSTIITSVANTNYYRGQQILELFPNPAKTKLIVKSYLEHSNAGSIDIITLDGKLAKTLLVHSPMKKGYAAYEFNIGDLHNGMYQLRFKTNEQTITRKLLVQH